MAFLANRGAHTGEHEVIWYKENATYSNSVNEQNIESAPNDLGTGYSSIGSQSDEAAAEWSHRTVSCISEPTVTSRHWYESSSTFWNSRLLDLQSISSVQRRWTHLAPSNILVNGVTSQVVTWWLHKKKLLFTTCISAADMANGTSKAHADAPILPTKHSHHVFHCGFSSITGPK